MPNSSASKGAFLRRPHPLAKELAAHFGNEPAAILELGTGSGRNAEAFARINFSFTSVLDSDVHTALATVPASAYDAVLSTHGLLHGNSIQLTATICEIARALRPNGLLYATFGSKSDARFGTGKRLDDLTFAPEDGDERGIPHVYYSRETLMALLRDFSLLSLQERAVDNIAGAWAHANAPLHGAVHWFVHAQLIAR